MSVCMTINILRHLKPKTDTLFYQFQPEIFHLVYHKPVNTQEAVHKNSWFGLILNPGDNSFDVNGAAVEKVLTL